ncbi:MAG: DUF4412 domain-containing protein [Gammaproteobacteria bacterium]|nr:DUF4412 domain-containing protein [Gammaproteobacteria bacterium]
MKKLCITLTLVGLFAGSVGAGVVYEIDATDHEQSPPKSESIQSAVEGRALKMSFATGADRRQGDWIYHADRREMIVVDHENRSYHVMDKSTSQQINEQVSSAMAQMQEALKNVPADQRAMVEQMMKQRMPKAKAPAQASKSELKRTGERADKNGYPCVKYEVYRDGDKVREMWVTDWDNIEGGSDVVDVFEEMSGFFREMLDALPDFAKGSAAGEPAFAYMKELKGFPVATEEFENGRKTGESNLRSAKRLKLDPDAFEPPSGYKRQSMFPQ